MITARSALDTGTVGDAMTPGILTCLPSTPSRLPIGVLSTLDIARAFAAETGDSTSG